MEAPDDEVVRKANELVRARHDFSVIEQRLFAAMVANVGRYDEEFETQRIRVEDICDVSGTDSSHIYRKLDEITTNLLKQVLVIRERDSDGEEQEFDKYSLFSRCKHQKGSGVILAEFDDNIREFLLELQNRFTLYLYPVFARLESKYSTQVYELLKMSQDMGRKYTHTTSVEQFRKDLGLEDKYSRFSDLKRRVIEQAQEELKEKADIQFTYEVHRESYTPKRITFYIQDNKDVIDELEAKKDQHGALNQSTGPNVDAKRLFRLERSQEEMERLSSGKVSRLYERARESVNGDPDSSYTETMVFRRMEEMWKG